MASTPAIQAKVKSTTSQEANVFKFFCSIKATRKELIGLELSIALSVPT
jgi:hypothetical protein